MSMTKDLKSRFHFKAFLIFLNGNKQEYYYQPGDMDPESGNQLSVRREEKTFHRHFI